MTTEELAKQLVDEAERAYMDQFSCTWGDDCPNPCTGQWDGVPICSAHYEENARREQQASKE